MMKRTLKSLLLLGSVTLLVACGTPATTTTKNTAGMDKTFTTLLKQERAVDEVAFTYHIANIQKEHADLMAMHGQFDGKHLNDAQMDQVELQAEELERAIASFSAMAPASQVHRKSEESLFKVLTIIRKLAKETIAVANTNGIDTLGGLEGTVADLARPLKVLDAKREDELAQSNLPGSDQLIAVFFQETELQIPEEKEGEAESEPKKERGEDSE